MDLEDVGQALNARRRQCLASRVLPTQPSGASTKLLADWRTPVEPRSRLWKTSQ